MEGHSQLEGQGEGDAMKQGVSRVRGSSPPKCTLDTSGPL